MPWGCRAPLPAAPEHHSVGPCRLLFKSCQLWFQTSALSGSRGQPCLGGDQSWSEPAPPPPSATHRAHALLEGPSGSPALFLRLRATPRILSCPQGKRSCTQFASEDPSRLGTSVPVKHSFPALWYLFSCCNGLGFFR